MTAQHKRGVALVAVLWIVAALSLLVAGMTQSVRQYTRTVAAARDAVVAQALGDAAIQLALQSLQVAQPRPVGRQSLDVQFGGVSVTVVVQPLNGLIDLDRAPQPLLASLLATAGGLPAARAQVLAQTLDEWRTSRVAGSSEPARFEAIEDLLLVPGVDYSLYERLRPLISVDPLGTGKVNPLAADVGVLAVLANGNLALAAQVAAAQDAGRLGIDTSGLDPRFIETGSTERYRLEARVSGEQGKIEVFSRSVAFGDSASGVPWQTLRTERWVMPAGAA